MKQPNPDLGRVTVEVYRSHTITRMHARTHTRTCTRYDSSVRVISALQRPSI